ncbi:hypothetical protein JIQ42_05317 [Leishmania sp. Namibia]|uniref:hypothetical protein n=1 Tax=Leishmania sp. Namibia TaxID=2802991 RepID=UPI001B776E1E|nr:hypothetical protein JIQ42_05317 [Leishmania sp. Namibia]
MSCEPKKSRSGGAPAVATAEAIQSPSRNNRLPYRRPLIVFFPVVILFVLFNYLAFGVEVDDKGESLVLPAYVQGVAMQRDAVRKAVAAGQVLAKPVPFNAFLFFEESVMGTLFQVCRFLCRSIFGIRVVCTLAWLIHFFELGVCFRICCSCNASFPVMLLYMSCTCVGGFAQLSPLIKARDTWVRELRATAAGVAAVTAEPKSKKNR